MENFTETPVTKNQLELFMERLAKSDVLIVNDRCIYVWDAGPITGIDGNVILSLQWHFPDHSAPVTVSFWELTIMSGTFDPSSNIFKTMDTDGELCDIRFARYTVIS